MTFLSSDFRPFALTFVVGAAVAISPFVLALVPTTALVAQVLGIVAMAMAVKRHLYPQSRDWVALIVLGTLIALAPFVPPMAPVAAFEWLKVVAGALIVTAGIWHAMSAPKKPAETTAAAKTEAARSA
jgi:hypothetical protein